MRILAIDPGLEQSAAVVFDGESIHQFAILDNYALREKLRYKQWNAKHLAIEMIASYGMPVGQDIFETCVWIGRFIEAFGGEHTRVYRREVKLHLCNSAHAKDANVRQALLDRFGGTRQKAQGNEDKPGPLYGIKADLWAALAVAVTWWDQYGSPT